MVILNGQEPDPNGPSHVDGGTPPTEDSSLVMEPDGGTEPDSRDVERDPEEEAGSCNEQCGQELASDSDDSIPRMADKYRMWLVFPWVHPPPTTTPLYRLCRPTFQCGSSAVNLIWRGTKS